MGRKMDSGFRLGKMEIDLKVILLMILDKELE